MKVAGLVRATAVSTFGPPGPRPVRDLVDPRRGLSGGGQGPRFVLSAIPSRYDLDVRTPTGLGAIRAFVEGDFAAEGRGFPLRHPTAWST